MPAEIIYGRNAILEALRAGTPLERVLVARGKDPQGTLERILAQAKSRGVPVEVVEEAKMDRLAPRHQGVCAYARPFSYSTLEGMLAVAKKRGEPPFVLLLDCLQDVHNLGSLVRTAEAVGIHGLILPERRAVGITPAVRKASAGAVEHLLITRVVNLARAMARLKDEGLWIVGIENLPQAQEYEAFDYSGPLALVVGSEGRGLRSLVRAGCDALVKLPMRGEISSLNAAVAGSIVLYHAWRAREVHKGKQHQSDS